MKTVLQIAKRDFRLLFLEPSALVISAVFIIVAYYFFFNLLGSFNYTVLQEAQVPIGELDRALNLNEWVVQGYFQILLVLQIFFIPLLIASLVTQERQLGTLTLLQIAPLTNKELVLAKLVASSSNTIALISIACLPVLFLKFLSPLEMLPVFSGILGLFLSSIAFSAIALFFSASVNSQALAGVLCLAVLLLLYATHLPSESLGATTQNLLRYLSPMWQLRELFRGVITLSPLAYFSTLVILSFSLTCFSLKLERLR